MLYFDKNRIFFGLLHYIFSEQSNVNWALKTSLVNYTGINEALDQKQYENDSISNDIIKYVKEVKPYHAQFDHYIEKYTTKDDICNIIPSDSLFPTIYVRFDAVSSYPDIKAVIYTYTESGEPEIDITTDRTIKYLNLENRTIYVRRTDKNGNFYWEFEAKVVEGDLVYIEKDKTLMKVAIDSSLYGVEFYILQKLSKKEMLDFENTTAANRLFMYKTQDFDMIKDYLNSHFKGITIDSGDFNIDRFGYDAFLYDLKRYEEPAKTASYCLVDTTKKQISVGDNTFWIESDETIEKTNLTITSSLKGEIIDYYLDNNQITLFYDTEKDEEITIQYNKSSSDIEYYYFVANTFMETDDENYSRTYIDYRDYDENGEYSFDMPYSPIVTNKIVVEIEKPNGYRKPFLDYYIKDKKIYVSKDKIGESNNKINWKIIISITDYSLIYDKIYTWEDVYGIANNKIAWENYYKNAGLIQNIDGNEFLNPYYEEDRPSELCVIYPQNTLFAYTSKANAFSEELNKKINMTAKEIFNFDFKNRQEKRSIRKSAKLLNDFNLGDTEIVFSKDAFDKPYMEGDKLQPGKLLIDSEIIEYFDYTINNDSSIILKKLRRGTNGTFIHSDTIKSDTTGYAYKEVSPIEYNVTPSYYYINNEDYVKLTINGNIPNEDLVKVYKTSNISLLSNITPETTFFIISDNSINLPEYDENNKLIKRGFLYINDIKIEYDNIESSGNNYIISNFNLPMNTTFSAGDRITSIKYNEVSKNDYIIGEESYDSLKHLDEKETKLRHYISFNNPLHKGECVIIENHNKNVF